MKQYFEELCVQTHAEKLIDITEEIKVFSAESRISDGLINVSVLRTSASLVILENASPNVRHDLEKFFDRLVPMDSTFYRHSDEGEDDMPAHIKSVLTNSNLSLTIKNTEVILGRWQGIFLFEHRINSYRRKILIHILGS